MEYDAIRCDSRLRARTSLGWALLLVGLTLTLDRIAVPVTASSQQEAVGSSFEKLTARELRIVDEDGNVVAQVLAQPKGGVLNLYNVEGQPVLMVGAGPAGSGGIVAFAPDHYATPGLEIGANKDGGVIASNWHNGATMFTLIPDGNQIELKRFTPDGTRIQTR